MRYFITNSVTKLIKLQYNIRINKIFISVLDIKFDLPIKRKRIIFVQKKNHILLPEISALHITKKTVPRKYTKCKQNYEINET